MKDINAEFKAARKVGTVVRYQDFLHAKKMAMLEANADGADAAARPRRHDSWQMDIVSAILPLWTGSGGSESQ